MPLKSPELDDRTYEQIVEEAKRLIPAYAPEWTDWNEHDPGITLIQLFAWMTEIIIYRQNQIPEKNYVEFLKFIGLELKPPTPAKAHLTFKLSEDAPEPVPIHRRTSVEAEISGDEEPVIFETDELLIALPTILESVQSYDGYAFSNATNDNTDGRPYHPFGQGAGKDSALYLGFSKPFPEPEIETKIRVEVFADTPSSDACLCEHDGIDVYPPATLIWEYYNDGWKQLDVIKDETKSFLRSGYICLKGPSIQSSDIKKSHKGLLTKEKEESYYIRCRVEKSEYESSPKIEMILINTVPATNAITVEDEIVGSSDGNPDQSFTVRYLPVLSKSLVLEVDEGDGWKQWKEIDNLNASGRHDKHYTLNRLTGEITLGDGLNGKIPFGGDGNIRASYRYGGGRNGNVGIGKISSLQSSVSYFEEVTNRKAAAGGDDEESLEKIKERAPQELKNKCRAVTSDDFESLAKQTPGMRVARAKALPLHHPEFSYELKVPGVVTVIIVPESENIKPSPSEGMIRTVCEHLNNHRLLTTELYVVPPRYKKVRIEADVVAKNRADIREVHKAVTKNIEQYYHPLTGGIDGAGWIFGGDIYFSEAYRVILKIPEVSRIDKLDIFVDEERQPHCQDVKIPGNCLVYSEDHNIIVNYDRVE